MPPPAKSPTPPRIRADPAPHHGTLTVVAAPLGYGLELGGSAALLAGVVGLSEDGRDHSGEIVTLLIVGVLAIGVGLFLGNSEKPERISRPMAMSMLVAGWLGVTIVGVIGFVASGAIGGIGDGIYESVSATTTTGFTTVADPQALTHGMRLFRVLLQWMSGLGVLIAGMGILPVAVGGVELTPSKSLRPNRFLAATKAATLRHIVGLYLLLTSVLIVAFIVAGMTPFDGFSYGLSTASTGGMANHADSIGHFDSFFIDWIATAGMVAAGGNLAVVWWAFRGAWESVWRSTELRLYGSLLSLGFLAVWLGGSDLSVTDSAFSIASMMSTTGFRSGEWAASSSFPMTVLLVAAGIGAMSASVGSGFRLARAARVALEVRRSLRMLLDPRRIDVIRMDGLAVNEHSLERTYAYLWMHVLSLGAVAALVHAGSLDVVGTLTYTLALVSNVGVLVDGTTLASHVDMRGWSQMVSAVAMVLGRLSIYPVLLTGAGFLRWLSRLRPPQRATWRR